MIWHEFCSNSEHYDNERYAVRPKVLISSLISHRQALLTGYALVACDATRAPQEVKVGVTPLYAHQVGAIFDFANTQRNGRPQL